MTKWQKISRPMKREGRIKQSSLIFWVENYEMQVQTERNLL